MTRVKTRLRALSSSSNKILIAKRKLINLLEFCFMDFTLMMVSALPFNHKQKRTTNKETPWIWWAIPISIPSSSDSKAINWKYYQRNEEKFHYRINSFIFSPLWLDIFLALNALRCCLPTTKYMYSFLMAFFISGLKSLAMYFLLFVVVLCLFSCIREHECEYVWDDDE